jgi:hypothetical protein
MLSPDRCGDVWSADQADGPQAGLAAGDVLVHLQRAGQVHQAHGRLRHGRDAGHLGRTRRYASPLLQRHHIRHVGTAACLACRHVCIVPRLESTTLTCPFSHALFVSPQVRWASPRRLATRGPSSATSPPSRHYGSWPPGHSGRGVRGRLFPPLDATQAHYCAI